MGRNRYRCPYGKTKNGKKQHQRAGFHSKDQAPSEFLFHARTAKTKPARPMTSAAIASQPARPRPAPCWGWEAARLGNWTVSVSWTSCGWTSTLTSVFLNLPVTSTVYNPGMVGKSGLRIVRLYPPPGVAGSGSYSGPP